MEAGLKIGKWLCHRILTDKEISFFNLGILFKVSWLQFLAGNVDIREDDGGTGREFMANGFFRRSYGKESLFPIGEEQEDTTRLPAVGWP